MAEYDLISKTALLEYLDMAMECKNCPRNADKDLYKCAHNPTPERCTCSEIAHICNKITEFATSADVQPVKRGRWVTVRVDGDLDIICNQCYERTIMRSDFCPYCGADMRGEGNG